MAKKPKTFDTALKRLIAEFREKELTKKAEKIKQAAEAAAPRKTGDYASKFEIRQGKWVVWVANTSRYANVIEFGGSTRNYPRSRPLGRALDAAQED